MCLKEMLKTHKDVLKRGLSKYTDNDYLKKKNVSIVIRHTNV